MPNFAGNLIGYPQVNRGRDAGTTQDIATGTIIHGDDQFWGGGEFIYCKFTAPMVVHALAVLTAVVNATTGKWEWNATPCPNTANLGQSCGVVVASGTTADFGWVQITGIAPVQCNANVAAGTAFGVAAAGQGGALTAGKQVLAARIIAASSTTVAKTLCTALKGSTELTVSNSDGWFIGLYLSGTGITTGSTVSDISPDGKTVTLSAATSAAVTGTVTGTYNNSTIYYNVAHFNRPHMQGQIS
jgi:hypothetical protein